VSQLPTGRNAHWHIIEFDQFGELVTPSIPIAKYKTILGLLVRDFIPIKYRKWIGKDNDEWKVPESEKHAIWENMIPQYFTFLVDYDREQVKRKQKKSWVHASRLSRGYCTRNMSLKVKGQILMVESTPSRGTSGRISSNTGYPRSTCC
jgi:hypothetical protein